MRFRARHTKAPATSVEADINLSYSEFHFESKLRVLSTWILGSYVSLNVHHIKMLQMNITGRYIIPCISGMN